jgi:hypothetical protein
MVHRFILAVSICIFAELSVVAHAEESPWEVIGRKESWKPYCEKTKALIAANLVRAYDLHDEVLSDLPASNSELIPVWSINVAGLSLPIPRYSQPKDFFVERDPGKAILGSTILKIYDKVSKSSISILAAPYDSVDAIRAASKKFNFDEKFLRKFAHEHNLPFSYYGLLLDRYRFQLSDIDCNAKDGSFRQLIAVLSKQNGAIKIHDGGSEHPVAYHLQKGIDAILRIQHAYLGGKASKKTWLVKLETEVPAEKRFIEVLYYFEDYNSFIDSLNQLPKMNSTLEGKPAELISDENRLNDVIAKDNNH